MSTGPGIAGVHPAIAGAVPVLRARDHRFFTGMAIAATLTVFAGFARTYYLRSAFGSPELTTLLHVHGALSTSWILLFLTQTSLVSARRTDLHRRLGVAGGALVVAVMVAGYLTAIAGARRGAAPQGAASPLAFLSVPIGTVLVFGILAGAGLYWRRRSETHKRLMLLATITILTPAIARVPRWFGPGGPPYTIGGTCLFVVACMAYDRAAHGRIHPAFLWGGLFLMLSLPLRFAVGNTDTWLPVARWLTE